jgi:predicted AlkP superfamily phosphohydrolase/phosphomutase
MKTIILGLDAFDAAVFERLYENGRLPNLARFVDTAGYHPFAVTNPPQSEVSWTSIATGLNPGGHGMFDFVHRNPTKYTPYVSLLPTQVGLTGTKFVPPHSARTIFDMAVSDGYPATTLWWPATFPARPQSPIRSLPGLGAPDIHGRLGVGTLFTTAVSRTGRQGKTAVEPLVFHNGYYKGQIKGPVRRKKGQNEPLQCSFQLQILDDQSSQLVIDGQPLPLTLGQWSPVVEIRFKVNWLFSLKAVTRFILTQAGREPCLYALPLQVHPLHAPWHFAAPRGFVKQLWRDHGPFLTIGWPQDTTGLEDGCLTDDQFLTLCEEIMATRERIFMQQIDQFKEGVLAAVFDSLDRVQHMFWRDRPDVVESWYQKLDGLVGRVEQRLQQPDKADTRLVIVSDHGFTDFAQKVHLNRWLQREGYLTSLKDEPGGELSQVDWSQTQAYALGLNSLYLNLAGREGQGIVTPEQRTAVAEGLRQRLLDWRDEQGQAVVKQAWLGEEAFDGPLTAYGPDLVVGYAPGFRASSQTGLGGWEREPLEANSDHWGADHCVAAAAVPGVIFASEGLADFTQPSYRDIPALAMGKAPDSDGGAPPPVLADEDSVIVEERLKSLGYL